MCHPVDIWRAWCRVAATLADYLRPRRRGQCQAARRGSITESIFIGKGQQPAAKQSPTRDPDTGRGEQRAGTKIFTARSGSVFSLKSIKNE